MTSNNVLHVSAPRYHPQGVFQIKGIQISTLHRPTRHISRGSSGRDPFVNTNTETYICMSTAYTI